MGFEPAGANEAELVGKLRGGWGVGGFGGGRLGSIIIHDGVFPQA
jgi:hypothetical protein